MNTDNTKSKCFIDFDRTIIDNKWRLFQFFCDNIEEKYNKTLNIEEFWNLKKMGIHELEWLNQKYSANLSIEEWNNKKKEKIEDYNYLKHDRIFTYTYQVLEKLKKKYILILVTRRDNLPGFFYELNHLKLTDYFQNILVIPHNGKEKSSLILENYKVDPKDMMVGDTEDDIVAGVKLGIQTFFTLSGIRSSWIIEKYKLNLLVTTIKDIRCLVENEIFEE